LKEESLNHCEVSFSREGVQGLLVQVIPSYSLDLIKIMIMIACGKRGNGLLVVIIYS
jgi:hypothetical protein